MIFFTKMQGTGNDFVVINTINQTISYDYSKLSEYLCNRKFGVGADGVIYIEKSDIAEVKMRIFNSDGTEAEMCGNGIRCLGKYLYEKSIVNKSNMLVETLAGIKKLELIIENKTVIEVRVNIGNPIYDYKKIPVICESTEADKINKLDINIENDIYEVYPISMGNPHAVCFVDDVNRINLEEIGKKIENYKYFPNRTNVEFVQIKDRNNVKVRVWERGVGETLGCGTGSCATGVVSYLKGFTEKEVNVELPGGRVKIMYNKDINEVVLSGEASIVYEGKIFD